MARTAIYRPTNETVLVGRAYKADGEIFRLVTVANPGSSGYARTYQARDNELQFEDPYPMAPAPPTRLPIPFASNSPPEEPRVPRTQEPPSGIDPAKLIWVNDPDLTSGQIAERIKGIGMIGGNEILSKRGELGGEYSSVDEIPLRIDALKKYFSLVNINMNPDEG
jgi:hypothetical protein